MGQPTNSFPLHELLEVVVVADKKEGDLCGKLKKDAVFEAGADFPVIAVPVFQSESGGQRGFFIQILHEGIEGLVDLFLPERR